MPTAASESTSPAASDAAIFARRARRSAPGRADIKGGRHVRELLCPVVEPVNRDLRLAEALRRDGEQELPLSGKELAVNLRRGIAAAHRRPPPRDEPPGNHHPFPRSRNPFRVEPAGERRLLADVESEDGSLRVVAVQRSPAENPDQSFAPGSEQQSGDFHSAPAGAVQRDDGLFPDLFEQRLGELHAQRAVGRLPSGEEAVGRDIVLLTGLASGIRGSLILFRRHHSTQGILAGTESRGGTVNHMMMGETF
jgi:hypothetical protein